jgi:F0F1-type ATP synthase epsilon subunit
MGALPPFTVIIRTPTTEPYAGPADMLRLSTEQGDMEMFSGHAPLAGTVLFSNVRVTRGDHREDFWARNGVVLMDPASNVAQVLVQRCERRDEIDYKSAKEYLDFILARLDRPDELNKYQVQFLEEEKLAVATTVERLEGEAGG